MTKPTVPPALRRRNADNLRRRLDPDPDPVMIGTLSRAARYGGSSKHKRNPAAFGLPPVNGARGDATLCDEHAGFTPDMMHMIPRLLQRGINAGLVGQAGRILWTVGDDGWIYEARITNTEQHEYHGYPVRPAEPIAELVHRRFAVWAGQHGEDQDRAAERRCRDLYGFAP